MARARARKSSVLVQEQQQRLVGDVLGQAVLGAQRLPCHLQHQLGVAQRRQRHPEDPVRVAVGGFGGGLQAQPGLARPAGAGQGQEARALEQGKHLLQLVLAAQEGRGRHGQVGAVQALERGELALAELVEALGGGQVLEPVLAQVAQDVRAGQRGGGGGDQHLAAVAAGGDAGRPVHVHAHIALLAQEGRTGMDAHAHPDRAGGESLRPLGGGVQGPRRGGECDEEGVALRVHFRAAVTLESSAQDAAMLGQGLLVALCSQLVQEHGRSLDVREEEGDGAGGEISRRAHR